MLFIFFFNDFHWIFFNFTLWLDDTVSADIKLETEGVNEEGPCGLSPNMYHPRRALKNAINEWLPEFKKFKPAWGPIAKPQQVWILESFFF